MNCQDAEPLILDWLKKELRTVEVTGLETHLEECGECRRKEDSLRRTLEVGRNAGGEEPSPQTWLELREKAEWQEGGKSGNWKSAAVWVGVFLVPVAAVVIWLLMTRG